MARRRPHALGVHDEDRQSNVLDPAKTAPRPAYKTASWFIQGVERWFVIPHHLAIDLLIIDGPAGRISNEITCHCPTEALAEHIAMALNRVGAPQ